MYARSALETESNNIIIPTPPLLLLFCYENRERCRRRRFHSYFRNLVYTNRVIIPCYLSLSRTHSPIHSRSCCLSSGGWSKNCARITLRMGSNYCCTELWVGRRKKRGAFPNTFSSKEGGDALTHSLGSHWVCCAVLCVTDCL